MITINFDYINIKSGYKILDIGCGEGRHTAKSLDYDNIFCIGADISPENLLISEKKNKLHEKLKPNKLSIWSLVNTDIKNICFKNKSFNIVICSEVLEHIYEEKKALNEITRVLKPKGILALSVPRFWVEKICWLLSDEYFNVNQGHIRIYKKKELISKIEQNGFKLIKTHYSHSLHSFFWWLKCFIGPQKKNSALVNLYHKFLVWDLMKKPFITKFLDKLLNPVFGKSIVLYFIKKG